MSQDEGSGTRLADMWDCISASIGGFICTLESVLFTDMYFIQSVCLYGKLLMYSVGLRSVPTTNMASPYVRGFKHII